MSETRFRIEWSEEAEKNLEKLPKNIQKRITDAVKDRLTHEPSAYGKPLIKEWKGHRRLRVGDFRVIYKIYENKVVVFIIDIDHRSLIYLK